MNIETSGLTPIERGTLLALMASGGKLRESGELKSRWGIVLRSTHRAKLKSMALVYTTGGTRKAPFEHELTEQGWAWARAELSAARSQPVPKGMMGLGALYVLLAGTGDALARLQLTPKDFFTGDAVASGSSMSGAAETAWTMADESLARALQQTPRLRNAIDPVQGLEKELRAFIGETIDALRHAARAREMIIEGSLGEVVAFDRRIHADDDPRAREGVSVRVVRPAIVQGEGAYRRMLRKAQVDIVS